MASRRTVRGGLPGDADVGGEKPGGVGRAGAEACPGVPLTKSALLCSQSRAYEASQGSCVIYLSLSGITCIPEAPREVGREGRMHRAAHRKASGRGPPSAQAPGAVRCRVHVRCPAAVRELRGGPVAEGFVVLRHPTAPDGTRGRQPAKDPNSPASCCSCVPSQK